jgi:hypothetical protein
MHISGHGDRYSLDIPRTAGEDKTAPSPDFANCFRELEDARIHAVILSSCETGRNGHLADQVLKYSKAKAVVGYPAGAYHDTCAIAEQLLYFQLLRRRVEVWRAVKHVNDSLFLLGEKDARMLYCWTREDGKLRGPCPWWDFESTAKVQPEDRSLLGSLVAQTSRRGKWAEEKMKEARDLINHIR